MVAKEIVAGCQLMQEGKPLAGEPVSGTVAVRPLANGPFVQANGVDLVSTLQAAYPKCQFLWLAKPAVKAAQGDGKSKDNSDPKK